MSERELTSADVEYMVAALTQIYSVSEWVRIDVGLFRLVVFLNSEYLADVSLCSIQCSSSWSWRNLGSWAGIMRKTNSITMGSNRILGWDDKILIWITTDTG